MLLRELLRDVVHRYIVTRHSLRSARPLMTLALHLFASIGEIAHFAVWIESKRWPLYA
jgi:hypothetical protein